MGSLWEEPMTRIPFLLAAVTAAGLSLGATCNSATSDFNYGALQNRCHGSYQLESGDVVRVHVWNEPNHSRDAVLVRHDGKISLPLLGDVHAAALTIRQLAQAVKARVQTFVPNPRVDVSLVTARSYQIFVMGEVRTPGTFTPQSQINVLQALSLAGGFSPFAKRDRIQVIGKSPNGEVRIPFNYDEVLKGAMQEQNLVLCRGDTVLVP
jgi:polysaccharide export outer membrane protein